MATFTDAKIQEIDYGGKILLPSSALDALLRLNIEYPMMFKLSNVEQQRVTHCGVLEFSAPEGRAIIPQWMLVQLGLRDGSIVQIESATLQKATFVKLKPSTVNFLEISNPRAVLEVEMRKYSCLTKGDKFPTTYVDQTIEYTVVDVKPQNAVCIIECDVNLDFDAPEGYVEPKVATTANVKPQAPPMAASSGAGQALGSAASSKTAARSAVFAGAAGCIGSKAKTPRTSVSATASEALSADLAAALPALPPVLINEDYKAGSCSFVRYDYKRLDVLEKELREKEKEEKERPSSVFQGGSRKLKT